MKKRIAACLFAAAALAAALSGCGKAEDGKVSDAPDTQRPAPTAIHGTQAPQHTARAETPPSMSAQQ